jgi:dipeptidase E
VERRIVALGGSYPGAHPSIDDFLLGLTGRERPRVCYLGTATGDSPDRIVRFYETFAARAEASHVELFGVPPPGIRERLVEQDLIWVGGGNTASMIAVWRVHGIDDALRAAWERGVVLSGSSAGCICWFEAGVTDSFGPELEPMHCLGFLGGSACPHYDGEERRRPTFRRLVAAGELPPGLAADDGAGLHFVGTELHEVVTAVPGARAYRVEPRDGRAEETPLPARELA